VRSTSCRFVAVLVVLVPPLVCSALAAPSVVEAWLRPDLHHPAFDAPLQLLSTTAREGEGADYVEIAAGATATIGAVQGPAIIYRIWSTVLQPEQILLTMKLDGRDQVLTTKGALPEGAPADDPLRALDGAAYWSYVPVPVRTKAEFVVRNLSPSESNRRAEPQPQ